MNLQSVGKWKGLIAFAAIASIAGCASNAVLTANSVPNPVLLGGPSHIKTEKNDVDVEIECSYSRNENDATGLATTTVKTEGENKASAAILKATQGNDLLDVQVSRMQVGAYAWGIPPRAGGNKNWISVKGGVAEAGKEKK